jgi:hypothetical protein
MDCLASDHVVPPQRHDVTIETVFSVWSVPRLYTEIPRITEAVGRRIGTSAVRLALGSSHGKFVVEVDL